MKQNNLAFRQSLRVTSVGYMFFMKNLKTYQLSVKGQGSIMITCFFLCDYMDMHAKDCHQTKFTDMVMKKKTLVSNLYNNEN